MCVTSLITANIFYTICNMKNQAMFTEVKFDSGNLLQSIWIPVLFQQFGQKLLEIFFIYC